MSKRAKIILGAVTFWPALDSAISSIFSLLFFAGAALSLGLLALPLVFLASLEVAISKNFPPNFLYYSKIVSIVILLIIYIRIVVRNKVMEKNKKVFWIILLLIGNQFSMPIYWFLYIWKDSSLKATVNIEPQNSINPPVITRSEKDPSLSSGQAPQSP